MLARGPRSQPVCSTIVSPIDARPNRLRCNPFSPDLLQAPNCTDTVSGVEEFLDAVTTLITLLCEATLGRRDSAVATGIRSDKGEVWRLKAPAWAERQLYDRRVLVLFAASRGWVVLQVFAEPEHQSLL